MVNRRRIELIGWLCAAMPLILVLDYLLLAAHVRLALGRWPTPVLENVCTLPVKIHQTSILVLFLVAVFAAPVAWAIRTIMSVWQHCGWSIRAWLYQVVVYSLGWAVLSACFRFDPTPFTEWFFD